jgi:integrase/recombinase XerD
MIGPHAFLQKDEIRKVLEYLHANQLRREFKSCLAIFRLSCCCGLRTCEIAGLNLGDFNANEKFPTVTVRAEVTKGKNGKAKTRSVPLWWDKPTFEDLKEWYHYRLAYTRDNRNRGELPFICGLTPGNFGKRLHRSGIAKKWTTSVAGALGLERAKQISIHKGRDTFISWALASGRSLKEVQLAVGHASISSTNVYTHVVDAFREKPDLFGGKSIAGREIAPTESFPEPDSETPPAA